MAEVIKIPSLPSATRQGEVEAGDVQGGVVAPLLPPYPPAIPGEEQGSEGVEGGDEGDAGLTGAGTGVLRQYIVVTGELDW